MTDENKNPRQARREAQTQWTTEQLPSITAGMSWMFGLLSIPLLLVPPTAIFTGALAVLFGHVARFKIKRRPELGGGSTATNGLLMGYLCLVAALALLPSIRMQSAITSGLWGSFRGVVEADSSSPFASVEASFLNGGAASTGNNDAAEEISTQLTTKLNELRSETFDGTGAHEIRTLCQKNEDGICILVLIPDLADFSKEARDAMLNLTWKQSQKLSFGNLTPGDDFLVAVRDRIRYQSMEFGRATKSPDRIAQPDSSFVDVTMFDAIFGSETAVEENADDAPQE